MASDWSINIVVDEQRFAIVVAQGVDTDFASVPAVLHSLLSPLNNTVYAAILHDYLYRSPSEPRARAIDRVTADRLFYWGMRAKGVWRVTSGLMYLGVRLGGRRSYVRV